MFRQHTSSVRRKTGFNSRTDLSNCGLACSVEATDPCKIGAMGSTPIRSTDNKTGLWSKGKTPPWRGGNPGSIPGGSTEWKVVGYGWPSRFAKPCPLTGMWVQIPCLPLAPMVKWTSCLVSTEVFRVRVLVGVLTTNAWCPWCSGHCTPGCEPEGGSSTLPGHPCWRRYDGHQGT